MSIFDRHPRPWQVGCDACGSYYVEDVFGVVLAKPADSKDKDVVHSIVDIVNSSSETTEVENEPIWADDRDDLSDAIDAAYPTRSGNHAHYARALELVSRRHSKGALVELVNYLLIQVDEERKKVEAEILAMGKRDLAGARWLTRQMPNIKDFSIEADGVRDFLGCIERGEHRKKT